MIIFAPFVMIALLLLASAAHADCDIVFDCPDGTAKINHMSYPIVCGKQTGRGIDGGRLGHVIKASGPRRPGLVAPGTPLLTTNPQLCANCFIHVANISRRFTNGCIGVTPAVFNLLKSCAGATFSIITP